MSWMCQFFQCRWRHVINVITHYLPGEPFKREQAWAGLYQCPRCKRISMGAPR